MAAGFPLGMHGLKTSRGIVSGYEPMDKDLYLSITAPINEGNSGGPLYNLEGKVVGINSAKLTEVSRVAFAIPSQQLAMMLDALYTTRQYMVPDLGFHWSPSSPDLNEYISGVAGADGGIFVRYVMPGGLFDKAGLEANDILLAIDDYKLDTKGEVHMEELDNDVSIHGLLTRKLIGADVKLSVYREGIAGSNSTLLQLTTKYDQTSEPAIRKVLEPIVDPPKYELVAGIVVMELSRNLVETFAEENPNELAEYLEETERFNEPKLIITNIKPGSIAAKAGTASVGHLVEEVNGQKVNDFKSLCASLMPTGDFWVMRTAQALTVLDSAEVRAALTEADSSPRAGACADVIGMNVTNMIMKG